MLQRKVFACTSTRAHCRKADAQTQCRHDSFSLSSTVKQMTPVFFHLNTDLEIMIQTQACYRLGMVNEAIPLSTLKRISPTGYFKSACILKQSCKCLQNRRNQGHWTTVCLRYALSILKSCLQWKLLPCLHNGDKAEVMIWLKKTTFADILCWVVLPSRTMDMLGPQ